MRMCRDEDDKSEERGKKAKYIFSFPPAIFPPHSLRLSSAVVGKRGEGGSLREFMQCDGDRDKTAGEKKGGYDKFVSSPTLLRHNNHQWLKNIFLSFCNMIP